MGVLVSGPQRIVSLVPSHTESLHDLGLADRVVGRTRFCIAPSPWVEGIPIVGGTKDASAEKILATRPGLVVADKDENPKPLIDELIAAGIDVIWSEIDTVQDAADFLRTLAQRCDVDAAGEAAAVQIEEALAAATVGDALPVFCPIWYAPWMTFDQTAYPSAMLEAAGFRNVFASGDPAGSDQKYFEVEPAHVAASDAAWTLLPTEPFPFHKRRDHIETAGLGAVGAEERIEIIDGEALTWFGTRTARSIGELATVRARLADQ